MAQASLPPSVTDDELLSRIAAGDGEAFTLFFRRRQAVVYRFALHLTGVPAVAEDVTQDVFVEVMREARRYDAARGTAAAWLCGIARNFVRRRFETDRLIEPLAGAGGQEFDVAAAGGHPLDDLTRAERVEALRRAILTLPFRYREVVVLCDLQELSYAEAAEAIGCAVGTIRSRLSRGRTLLAAKLTLAREAPEAEDGDGAT
ncbi:MAG TPA: sigma-70 family RNA polymerase sigma factor, partial [Vicinamibacterales bacterium]|nr:sigma-70 family RNA polymerase sigma factor [Vicinamibacterales bacterium]